MERLDPGRTWQMLIGGRLVASLDGSTMPVHDPATEEMIASVPLGRVADIDVAVDAAHSSFPQWRDAGPSHRGAVVRRIADLIDEHGEELALLDTLDTGVPLTAMRRDVSLTVEQIRYFAGLALHTRGETIPTDSRDSLDFTLREPFGVVARISPFNHPLMLAVAKLAAPLIAGNTVVLKPSEHTPLSALRLGELLSDELPPGVVNVVTGLGGEAGDRLSRHPQVRRISFTGGVEAGLTIQRAAASTGVKHVSLELGGKNPIIVCADADVEEAADGALRGMNFAWAGQSCGSTSRAYVHSSLMADFISLMRRRIGSLIVGDPFDPATQMGALSSRPQFEKVSRYLRHAQEDPEATVVAGGPEAADIPHRGLFVSPTLVQLESDANILAQEEIFGPVLSVIPFEDLGSVIRACNASPYGLSASVYSRDLASAMSVVRALESGYVWVNWTSTHVPGTPFGGVKDSGNSREDELQELLSYTQTKNVFINYAGGLAPPHQDAAAGGGST
jgi:betaine-aldehyde dehydrogenase